MNEEEYCKVKTYIDSLKTNKEILKAILFELIMLNSDKDE